MNILTSAFADLGFVGPPDPTWCPLLWASHEVRRMGYVTSYGERYTHITYPRPGATVEDQADPKSLGAIYARNLARSLVE